MKRQALVGVVIAVALGVATATGLAKSSATASPVNWTVWAGPSGLVKRPPPGVPKSASADLFFPSVLTIHAGDSVTIKTREGHTATILGRTKLSYFRFFKKQGTYSGVNDSAGTPFWFNGKPKVVYTVGPFFNPSGSLAISNHTTLHNRTILGPDPHNPPGIKSSVTYTFPNPGTYTILCLFHYPVMKLKVIVKPAGAEIPGNVQNTIADELAAAVATAKSLAKTVPTAKNTFWMGVTKDGIDMLQFFPAKLTVPIGTTVTFTARSIVENHNTVFGGPKTPWIRNYLKHSDQFPDGQVGPEEVYGTEPTGGYQYDGTNHGNGFLVTPITDRSKLTPFGATSRVTFTKAGTYHFFCEIHGPDMSADIVVTP